MHQSQVIWDKNVFSVHTCIVSWCRCWNNTLFVDINHIAKEYFCYFQVYPKRPLTNPIILCPMWEYKLLFYFPNHLTLGSQPFIGTKFPDFPWRKLKIPRSSQLHWYREKEALTTSTLQSHHSHGNHPEDSLFGMDTKARKSDHWTKKKSLIFFLIWETFLKFPDFSLRGNNFPGFPWFFQVGWEPCHLLWCHFHCLGFATASFLRTWPWLGSMWIWHPGCGFSSQGNDNKIIVQQWKLINNLK